MKPENLWWIAVLFLLFQAWQGWRLGPIRQLVRLGALAAAYLSGFLLSGAIAPLLRPTGLPELLVRPAAGTLIGLVAYFTVSFIGKVVFKKTSDQELTFTRILYGITGSALGVATGTLFIAIILLAVRLLGTFAEGIVQTPPPSQVVATAAAAEPSDPASQATPPPSTFGIRKPTASDLVELKTYINESPAGKILERVDPIPPEVYRTIEKVGKVVSNPTAVIRFLSFPGAKELLQRPEIIALRDDPDIIRAVQEGRYLDLLTNKAINDAASEPELGALLQKFKLEEALDFANGVPPKKATSPLQGPR